MAKVIAPLLSFGGSGAIGKAIVFGDWRGIQTARSYVVPANPQSAAQTVQRSSFATLREMWKRLDADGRAPWDAYATGRRFLGLNAFIGENRLSITDDSDMNNFVGSPGARGGIPITAFSASAGSGSGEIDVDITMPSVPTGWAITDAVYVAIRDQAPTAVLEAPPVSLKVSSDPWDGTFTGLGAGEDYVVAAWAVMTKPDNSVAYSASITDTATATA